ncbi:MAG: hypothetical protein CM15mP85_08070 [Rhodobacterales bacterium]|nr:MAG: hypothetical protein CM15mP85_08070 [Rhodobacterales bacterium]
MKTVVNSWNEWDPLKHVIVGRADDCHIPPEEPALDAKVPEDSDMRGQWGRRPQETIDRANELLDNFASLLEKRGIRVDRPTPIDFSKPATTPDFHTDSQFGCMPPRDVLLTVGSEILEATMSYRCRWFEYLCYRPLMEKYWEEDPNFRHEAAPKPRLTDRDYRADYLSEKIGIEKRLKWTAEKFFVTTEEEPLLMPLMSSGLGKTWLFSTVSQQISEVLSGSEGISQIIVFMRLIFPEIHILSILMLPLHRLDQV